MTDDAAHERHMDHGEPAYGFSRRDAFRRGVRYRFALSGAQYRVLDELLDFIDPYRGTCFPGFALLAERLNMPASTLSQAVDALEEYGLIAREDKGIRSSKGRFIRSSYVFNWTICHWLKTGDVERPTG